MTHEMTVVIHDRGGLDAEAHEVCQECWEPWPCPTSLRLDADGLKTVLQEHRYYSDDVGSEDCGCGEWPKKYTRGGNPKPIPDWVTHVVEATFGKPEGAA